jgi:ribonucleoside-diphosphate reductase alpha chain
MLRVYDTSSAYVDQGGRRPGAIAVYIEMHHPEVLDFLEVRKNFTQNDRNIKCLFPAIWMPDLFMKRVESDGYWSFFDPKKFAYLAELYGKEYEDEYELIEKMNLFVRQDKARNVWKVILECLVNTGLPYIVSKDRVNKCSNQKNLGTIKSSNLCTEIVQYSSPEEISCCTLASVVLPSFVENGNFDYQLLNHAMHILVKSLDHVIDLNDYSVIPDGKTYNSSTRHRPIAVGVVGMADMFLKMRMVFGSDTSQVVNEKIAEQMYWSAIDASCELAQQKERYITFHNSPLANGIFHFEMWQKTMEEDFGKKIVLNTTLDWESLRSRVKKHGVRNSLFIGHMPTGTNSQILGVHECFEPFTSNIYARRIGAGDITMVNKFLINDLKQMGVWNEKTYKEIIREKGSIQKFTHFTREDGTEVPIPVFIRSLYRTVYEVKPKRCIDMVARRSPYIDQSSSNNIYYPYTSVREMTKTLFYAWRSGLKTIQYYGRTAGAIDPIQFTCVSCST